MRLGAGGLLGFLLCVMSVGLFAGRRALDRGARTDLGALPSRVAVRHEEDPRGRLGSAARPFASASVAFEIPTASVRESATMSPRARRLVEFGRLGCSTIQMICGDPI